MSNWYDPDHLSDGKVRDISVHEENPDDWDCEIEHSNALRKESSVREEKTLQPSQQKWQEFSRQLNLHFLFSLYHLAVSLCLDIFHRTRQLLPGNYQYQLGISYKGSSSFSFIFCKLDRSFEPCLEFLHQSGLQPLPPAHSRVQFAYYQLYVPDPW